jgi:hypothetical protein
VPRGTAPSGKIGSIDLEGIKSNFDRFPEEYLDCAALLEKYPFLAAPFPIRNLAGNLLLKTDDVKKVGGFNDQGTVPLFYGGETNLGVKLHKEGGGLWFCPSPLLATVHLRWGYHQKELLGDLRYAEDYGLDEGELEQMVVRANERVLNSGSRLTPEEWQYVKIRDFTRVIAKLGPRYRAAHTARVLHDAVRDRCKYYSGELSFLERIRMAVKGLYHGYTGRKDKDILG